MAITIDDGSTTSKQQQYWRILHYGDANTGKTRTVGACVNKRVLLIDCERGSNVVRAYRTRTKLEQSGVIIIPVANTREFGEALAFAVANANKFDIVCIDTLSELANLKKADFFNRGITKLEHNHWGELKDFLTNLMLKLRSLPCHIVVLAHEKVTVDITTSRTFIRPNFEGDFQKSWVRHFDVVGRQIVTKIKDKPEPIYCICYQSPAFTTRDRSEQLAQYEPAVLEPILDKLSKSIILDTTTTDFSKELSAVVVSSNVNADFQEPNAESVKQGEPSNVENN